MRGQRRGRKIAFDAREADAFLRREPLCRVATVGPNGTLHNSPLWYVWEDGAIWLYSIVKSQRWANLARSTQVSVVVDAGSSFADYAAVEVTGAAEVVGPAPWSGEEVAALAAPAAAFGAKYTPDTGLRADGRHAWLRVQPESLVSWDFAKL